VVEKHVAGLTTELLQKVFAEVRLLFLLKEHCSAQQQQQSQPRRKDRRQSSSALLKAS